MEEGEHHGAQLAVGVLVHLRVFGWGEVEYDLCSRVGFNTRYTRKAARAYSKHTSIRCAPAFEFLRCISRVGVSTVRLCRNRQCVICGDSTGTMDDELEPQAGSNLNQASSQIGRASCRERVCQYV